MSNDQLMYNLYSNSAEETAKLGEKIGKSLKENDVIALFGPLGAGKTTLIQGVAKGLSVKDYVTSPTFILINEYTGRIPLFHIDLYRLDDAAEIKDLGIEEYFSRGGVCVIEWAEKLSAMLPNDAKKIVIRPTDENKREIDLSWQF